MRRRFIEAALGVVLRIFLCQHIDNILGYTNEWFCGICVKEKKS